MDIDRKNPDTSIKIGDRVRSYDFPDLVGSGHPGGESYMEGIVYGIIRYRDQPQDFTCDSYAIRVERQVCGGEEKFGYPDNIYPPLNGTPSTMGGVTYGVVKL